MCRHTPSEEYAVSHSLSAPFTVISSWCSTICDSSLCQSSLCYSPESDRSSSDDGSSSDGSPSGVTLTAELSSPEASVSASPMPLTDRSHGSKSNDSASLDWSPSRLAPKSVGDAVVSRRSQPPRLHQFDHVVRLPRDPYRVHEREEDTPWAPPFPLSPEGLEKRNTDLI